MAGHKKYATHRSKAKAQPSTTAASRYETAVALTHPKQCEGSDASSPADAMGVGATHDLTQSALRPPLSPLPASNQTKAATAASAARCEGAKGRQDTVARINEVVEGGDLPSAPAHHSSASLGMRVGQVASSGALDVRNSGRAKEEAEDAAAWRVRPPPTPPRTPPISASATREEKEVAARAAAAAEVSARLQARVAHC